MKIFQFLIILFFLQILFSQENISDEIIDNQIPEIILYQDSLVIQDSLTIIDSTEIKIDLKKEVLEKNIKNSNSFRNFNDIDLFLYSENYHLFSPLNYNIWLEKNDFTLTNKKDDNLFYLRSYLPFNFYSYNQQFMKLYRDIYDSPIAFTNTFLGIGDEEMNVAYVSFNKGNVFNLRDLSLSFEFFTQSGFWFSTDEKTQNFQIRLNYEKWWGKLLFSTSSIEQNITDITNTIIENTAKDFNEKGSDIAIIFQNKFADIGYRKEKIKIAENETDLQQIFITQNFEFFSNIFTPKYEYISTQENDEHLFSLSQQLQTAKTEFSNYLKFKNYDEFYVSTDYFFLSSQKLGFEAFFNQIDDNEIVYKESGIGLKIDKNILNSKLSFGKINSAEKKYYLDLSLKLEQNYRNWLISLDSWTLFVHNSDDVLPKWSTKNFIEIGYDMQHNNLIKIGLSHYITDFYEYYSNVDEHINIINSHLSIGITEYFEIRLNVNNLLNNNNELSPVKFRHFVVNLKWIFVN
ncbi:MAG: hypothetical protein K8S23_09785 [Candidatus Cloacimonetes bacterium]|nr:hypothetical protein [Candidatus Cloacimonadota bacterium]